MAAPIVISYAFAFPRSTLHHLKTAIEAFELDNTYVNLSTEGTWPGTLANVWNATFSSRQLRHELDMEEPCCKEETRLFVTVLD